MCLYTTNKEIQIAKEDIICYKILIKERINWIFRIFRKFIYRAPFYAHYTYQLKELKYLGKSLRYDYEVREGFHSFADIRDAERMLYEWYETQGGQTIVQCIIPKGAEYIKGTISQSENSPVGYVSNEIICIKEV